MNTDENKPETDTKTRPTPSLEADEKTDSDDSLTTFQSAVYTFAIIGLWTFSAAMWPMVKSPGLTWSMITGTPYNFDHAVRQVELKTVPQDEFKSTEAMDLSIAAGIVVSEDALRAYDLGPNMDFDGVSDFGYPRDDLEIELWNYNLHDDHQSGQLIGPLHDWLSHRAHTLKMLLGRDVTLRVFIAVDRKAGFSIERQIMYTAGQAQHSEIVKVVDSPAGVRLKPNNYPSIGLPEVVNPTGNRTSSPSNTLNLLDLLTPASPPKNELTEELSGADAEAKTEQKTEVDGSTEEAVTP
jgi:hypothetical protein